MSKRAQAELLREEKDVDGEKGFYVLSNGIEKSPSDEREFLAFTLPNGLKALVVSDETCDKAGAGLNVGIGHFADERDLPGLAHFLEHMVFMGTEKFPDENEYSSFLSKSGGSSNAYTDTEETCFFFDINHTKLYEALDRFAQFFISPLMTESSQQREVQAVDNEHSKNLQVDAWRLQQLERSTSNPKHPFSGFGTGSAETLDKAPKERGIDIRSKLLEFHNRYYKANRMALVLVGREPVSMLRAWVEKLFDEVPMDETLRLTHAPSPDYQPGSIFPPSILNRIMFAESVKNKFTIEITWELPPFTESYMRNPSHYIDNMLGHESKGSLFANLKERELAVGLSAGLNFECDDFSLLKITIDCTEKGAKMNYAEVLATVFRYCKLVRDEKANERFFRETQQVEEIRFRFQSKPDTFRFCRETASALLRYPVRHVLTAEAIVRSFDPDLTQRCLDLLIPERARVLIAFKSAKSTMTHLPSDKWQTEPWYGTQYAVDDTQTLLDIAKLVSEASDGPTLHLPDENVFIPENFALSEACSKILSSDKLQTDALKKQALIRPPSRTSGMPSTLQVWHKTDRTFLQPKAIFKGMLVLPASYSSPRASVLAELSAAVACDVLNEFAYNAQIAGLSWSWQNTVRGMTFGVAGYNDKLKVLLEKIISVVTNLDSYRSGKVLERQLERYQRSLENFQKENPYQIAMYQASVAFNVPRWHVKDKLRTIKERKITCDELCQFVANNVLQGAAKLVTLCIGNVTRTTALEWSEACWSKFRFETSYSPQPPRVVVVPANRITFSRLPGVESNVNSAIEFVCQIGPESMFPKCGAMTLLLGNIAEEPCFNQLRTIQQLGYIVSLGVRRELAGVLSIRIVVQSGTHAMDVLFERAFQFLKDLRGILEELSEEEFREHVQACADQHLEADLTLAAEARRWWDEIDHNSYYFDRDQVLAKEISSLTKNQMLDFYDRFLNPDSSERRFFVSGVQAAHSQAEPKSEVGTDQKLASKVSSERFGRIVYLKETTSAPGVTHVRFGDGSKRLRSSSKYI